MANDNFAGLVARHMENAAATMAPLAGIDFARYGAELTERFRNPEIAHETRQIAMDGTEKLPQRIFAPVCDLAADSRHRGTFALCFAAWIAFVQSQINPASPGENSRLPDDPRADEIAERIGSAQDAADLYDRLAGLPGWMPRQLCEDASWRMAVISRLVMLLTDGADAAIRHELGQ